MSMLRDQDMIFVRWIWVWTVEGYNLCMVVLYGGMVSDGAWMACSG